MVNEKMFPQEPADFEKDYDDYQEALHRDQGTVSRDKEEAMTKGKNEIDKKLEKVRLEQLERKKKEKIAVQVADKINELKEDEVLLLKYMEDASHHTTKLLHKYSSRELRPLVVRDILNELGFESDIRTDDDLKNEIPELETGVLTAMLSQALKKEKKRAEEREEERRKRFGDAPDF